MVLVEIEPDVWINPDKLELIRYDRDNTAVHSKRVQLVMDDCVHTCRTELTIEQAIERIDRVINKKSTFATIMENALEEVLSEKEKGEKY